MTAGVHLDGWKKSTFSTNNGGACVEVKFAGDRVLVRDSKYRRDSANDVSAQPFVAVPVHGWSTLCDIALGGISGTIEEEVVRIAIDTGGAAVVSSGGQGIALSFTAEEWDAFGKGIANGEFDRP